MGRRSVFAACSAYYFVWVACLVAVYLRPAKHAAIFGSFWEAGRHLDYSVHPLVWRTGEGFLELNLNPPTLFPLFQFFALFDPQVGQTAWQIFSAALYFGTAWFLRKSTPVQILWLFTVPMVYAGLALGQIYFLLFALGAAIWWALKEDRPVLAAVLVGVLIAMKPNFGVWVLLALASGHLRPAVIAGAVAVFFFAAAALLYGPSIYPEWLTAVARDSHGLHPHNVSAWAFFSRLGLPIGPAVAAVLLAAILTWAVRYRPTLYDLTPVAILAAVLCSPLAWLDYVLVAVAFIVDRPWKTPMLFAAFLMFGSILSGAVFHWASAWLIPISILCAAPAVIMLVHFLRRAVYSDANGRQRITGPYQGGLSPAHTERAAL